MYKPQKENKPTDSLLTYREFETARVFLFFPLHFKMKWMGDGIRHIVLQPLFQLWDFCACSLMSSAELQMSHTSYCCDLLTLIAEKVMMTSLYPRSVPHDHRVISLGRARERPSSPTPLL